MKAARRRLPQILVVVVAFALCTTAPVPAQTVTTDKPDYMPGWTVVITGSGWWPAETVSLLIHEEPQLNADVALSVAADDTGSFVNSDFVVPTNAGGTAYVLTATGQASLATALATFTDGIAQGSLCAPSPATARTFVPRQPGRQAP